MHATSCCRGTKAYMPSCLVLLAEPDSIRPAVSATPFCNVASTVVALSCRHSVSLSSQWMSRTSTSQHLLKARYMANRVAPSKDSTPAARQEGSQPLQQVCLQGRHFQHFSNRCTLHARFLHAHDNAEPRATSVSLPAACACSM